MWGVSAGASIALKILALGEVPVQYTIADAPYVFEKVTLKDRVTAVIIGLAVAAIPFAGKKRKASLLKDQKVGYGEETGQLFYEMMLALSSRSLFREFYSCFTFTMPEDTSRVQTKLALWYGERETEKHEDARYLADRFPNANPSIHIFPGYSHANYWVKDMESYLRDIAAFAGEEAIHGDGHAQFADVPAGQCSLYKESPR